MNKEPERNNVVFFLLPCLSWAAINLVLVGLTPQNRLYLFPRFHALLAVYFCFVWVLCRRPNLFMLGQGILAIVSGLTLVAVACSPTAKVLGQLALTLSAYLAWLAAVMALLRRWLPGKTAPLLVFTAVVLAAMADLLLLMLLPATLRYNDLILTVLLYLNPLIVVSRCFPGYDFLRGPVFYPLMTTFLGPFRYPELTIAIAHFILAALLFSGIARIKRQTNI